MKPVDVMGNTIDEESSRRMGRGVRVDGKQQIIQNAHVVVLQ